MGLAEDILNRLIAEQQALYGKGPVVYRPEVSIVPLYVVDTSVILKWYYRDGEDSTHIALKLRDKYAAGRIALITPELALYELTNVLCCKKKLEDAKVIEALDHLLSFSIIRSLDGAGFSKAIHLSSAKGISVYDASFAALATANNCSLITVDERLCKKLDNALLLQEMDGLL
ncbi:MAG: type II toxin-antitoxin system VapC family toxin [bacterium]|nr:type II toxin-antitoxin system VapC family toxin [bacterium]